MSSEKNNKVKKKMYKCGGEPNQPARGGNNK